jgi:hypothetical protein
VNGSVLEGWISIGPLAITLSSMVKANGQELLSTNALFLVGKAGVVVYGTQQGDANTGAAHGVILTVRA